MCQKQNTGEQKVETQESDPVPGLNTAQGAAEWSSTGKGGEDLAPGPSQELNAPQGTKAEWPGIYEEDGDEETEVNAVRQFYLQEELAKLAISETVNIAQYLQRNVHLHPSKALEMVLEELIEKLASAWIRMGFYKATTETPIEEAGNYLGDTGAYARVLQIRYGRSPDPDPILVAIQQANELSDKIDAAEDDDDHHTTLSQKYDELLDWLAEQGVETMAVVRPPKEFYE
jgi:hypothetical protein